MAAPDNLVPYSIALNPKRALEENWFKLAQMPAYMHNMPFNRVMHRVADCDLLALQQYFEARARQVQTEIEVRTEMERQLAE